MEHDSESEAARPLLPTRRVAIFVERTTRRWVVLDPEGHFWILPGVEDAWRDRQPFEPTEETPLEPVPGHYRHLLGLPF